MAQRRDIQKIVVIGSGPAVIGQASEFDYSCTQACKALRSLGYDVVLVDSNPAAVVTDPSVADHTYIEPLNEECLTRVIEKERPDALLPGMGGHLAIRVCAGLNKKGILAQYGVRIAGIPMNIVEGGENHIAFKKSMDELGLQTARSIVCSSVEEVLAAAGKMEYPVVLRPAYTCGGSGSGIAEDEPSLRALCARTLQSGQARQVLVEETLTGWKELELVVLRDAEHTVVPVCFMENLDPVGIHTGDSVSVIPMLTVPEDVQKEIQRQGTLIVEHMGIIGCADIKFAWNQQDGRVTVISFNPRMSRSSVLASKVTGVPVASISARLAAGLLLREIPCADWGTMDQYQPGHGPIAVKFPRWDFHPYDGAKDILGTQMRSIGEAVALGRNFKEALQKVVCSLEQKRYGLGQDEMFMAMTPDELMRKLAVPSSERYFMMYEALRKGAAPEEIQKITQVHSWFITQIKELADEENALRELKGAIPSDAVLVQAKKDGFSDACLSHILEVPEDAIRIHRQSIALTEKWQAVSVNSAMRQTGCFSTYNGENQHTVRQGKPKIIVLGSGPERIGQSGESDYGCIRAMAALKKSGFETIMVNCDPAAVSTGEDAADTVYIEPLTVEHVLEICRHEKPVGVIGQFGGRAAEKLIVALQAEGVHILGTDPGSLNLAGDWHQFQDMMNKIAVPVPESGSAVQPEDALHVAEQIGYPVVLHIGDSKTIIHDPATLETAMKKAGITADYPVYLDRFLHTALKCEADAVSDGRHVFIPAVMEHIELAGIHSGDSACVIPSRHIAGEALKQIQKYTEKIAVSFHVMGLMNIRYAIEDDQVYVLEVNLGGSRTMPLVSKLCHIPLPELAAEIMTLPLTGKESPVPSLTERHIPFYGVKESVFPFDMFPEVDPVLGPEMRSTGEVLGLAKTSGEAFYKAEEAAGGTLPLEGAVLISVSDADKPYIAAIAQEFAEDDFAIYATDKTFELLQAACIPVKRANKLGEGSPNIEDLIADGTVQMVINTPSVRKDAADDDGALRKAAVRAHIPYVTTIVAARASVEGMHRMITHGRSPVLSLQEWQHTITDK